MRYTRCWLLALALGAPALVLAGGPDRTTAGIAALDAASIYRDEADWPYYVALTAPWRPPAAQTPLTPGLNAVLVRVEADGTARIDFGRDGIHRVPIEKTDLVSRALRIRERIDVKQLPNFTFAITPRLVDSAGEEPRGFPIDAFALTRVFVCWFADPTLPEFAKLADAMNVAPLASVTSVFFPQGRIADLAVRDELRKLGHSLPFALDHLSEPYTATLIDKGASFPYFLVVTAEGRWLGEGSWDASAARRVREILQAALGLPAIGAGATQQ